LKGALGALGIVAIKNEDGVEAIDCPTSF